MEDRGGGTYTDGRRGGRQDGRRPTAGPGSLVSSSPLSLCSNNTKQFPLTFLRIQRAEMTELRMPHSIIAKEIKVPLIAFGQVVQFFPLRPSLPLFFVIKVVSNINNHSCVCAQGLARTQTRTCVHAVKDVRQRRRRNDLQRPILAFCVRGYKYGHPNPPV